MPDEQVLRTYCGKCGSRLEGGRKCYCIQCGEESIYLTGQVGDSWLKKLLTNPKVQFAIAGVCVALLMIPLWLMISPREEQDLGAQARAKAIRAQVGKTAPDSFSAKKLNIYSAEFAGLQLKQLSGVVKDVDGTMYITDSVLNMVYKIGVDGKQTAIAGTGKAGFSGDLRKASDAQLNRPRGITIDSAGNLYIADTGNNVVRLIDRAGDIRTIAGMAPEEIAKPGKSLDNARRVELLAPVALSVGLKNEVYVTEDPNAGGSRSPSVWILEPEGLPVVSRR